MKEISRRNFIPAIGALLVTPSLLSVSCKTTEQQYRIRPKALSVGDAVGLCASAGASHDLTEVDGFISVLQGHGFLVKEGKNVRKKMGYFSASDQERAAEFMTFILDSNVKAIFFTRGGWGCARILEFLDFEAIRNNPKIIMGFSDICSLLNAITFKTGLTTFHGPNGNASWNEFSWKSIEDLIVKSKTVKYPFPSLDLVEAKPVTLVSGKATGELFGGNLTVMTGLLGSTYLPDWTGKILFFEDVLEEPYSIDRMLTQWKLNGVFDKVAGVILCQFRKCVPEEPEWSFTLNEVFQQHFKSLSIPVFSGFTLGHVKNKYSVPIGENVSMDADKFMLELNESAVTN
ncbi:MAG: hypothetical protein RI883_2530 [Bacteroidota bacterium]